MKKKLIPVEGTHTHTQGKFVSLFFFCVIELAHARARLRTMSICYFGDIVAFASFHVSCCFVAYKGIEIQITTTVPLIREQEVDLMTCQSRRRRRLLSSFIFCACLRRYAQDALL